MSKALAPAPSSARQPSRTLVLAGNLLLLAAVGWIDYATGWELRVFPLYFLPLTFVSLSFRRPAALGFSLLCAATWLGSNHLAGMAGPNRSLVLANTAIMLVAFAFVTILAANHRTSLERERALSRTDSLTGLPNSRGFYEAAGAEVVRLGRYRHPVTLAYLDIDDFKEINDRYGHACGDELLVAVAQVLRRASRSSDLVGRLGGDEFVILYPETGRDAAEAVLRKLQGRLRDSLKEGDGPRLTVSIGAVSFAVPPAALETLVRQADALMYAVKTSGKDGVCAAEGASEPS
jgi:diguanylate cyclase (GGDEF)-like protein